ncbi:MAG: recombinase family protein [Lachnospiraceae bacterium]|nr:recombinase family protein [Lachnospiraceae bacterium]
MRERAVIYCRVSTEEEKQINALENQMKEARNAAKENGWIIVDEYIDEGKSGTTTRKREEYNRLVNHMTEDRFDIIIIKSQDRLMRNTKEWYLFVDKLVVNHKKLYLYLEHKFYTTDDALITGIKAILAEEYSRELSKKVNHAHANRQKNGNSFVITSNTWGYDKVNKQIKINEKEAEIVRFIYEMCANGHGSRSISKMLQEKGIESRSGGHFSETTIRKIIRNPLFKGTALLNVRHKDFETKSTVYTNKEDWIVREHAVPPIVSEEIWTAANEKMDQRSRKVKADEYGKRAIGINLGKQELSGKIICGYCGSSYWRTRYKNKTGAYTINWSCSEYVSRGRKSSETRRRGSKAKIKGIGGCDNIHIKDDDLNQVLKEAAQLMQSQIGYDIVQEAFQTLEQIIKEESIENILCSIEEKIREVQSKRELLVEKMLEGIISDDMFQIKEGQYKERYEKLLEEKETYIAEQRKRDSDRQRLSQIQERIKNISENELAVEEFVQEIDKIIVYPHKLVLKFYLLEDMIVQVKQINYRKKEFTICR